MKVFLAIFFIISSSFATEAMFLPPFTQIKEENKKAKETREEIERNAQLLIKLSKKNILLETELSSILNEIAKAPDFNAEALYTKTSGVHSDIATGATMQDGFTEINEEIKSGWKTKK